MPRIAPAPPAAEEEEEPERWCFKLALLGDAGVGKTALVKRLLGDDWSVDPTSYTPTLGVEFYSHELVLPVGACGSSARVTLQVRDVGSRVASLRMAATYLHACDAVLVVHDVTHPQTLDSALEWLALVAQMFAECGLPLLALVGNNADTPALQADAAAAAAPSLTADGASGGSSSSSTPECLRFCVSAATGWQVGETFRGIAARLAGLPVCEAADADAAAAASAQEQQQRRPDIDAAARQPTSCRVSIGCGRCGAAVARLARRLVARVVVASPAWRDECVTR